MKLLKTAAGWRMVTSLQSSWFYEMNSPGNPSVSTAGYDAVVNVGAAEGIMRLGWRE